MKPPSNPTPIYKAISDKATKAANLGATGDEKDLYALIDLMTATVEAHLPPLACGAGCCECCFTGPLVTSLEWQTLYPAILALPDDVKAQVQACAERLRPLAAEMADYRANAIANQADPNASPRFQCPLLINGQCSVYAKRPLACRGFGYFQYTAGDAKPTFFGSKLALAHIDATFKVNATFPELTPFMAGLGRLRDSQRDRGTVALLAQWVWTHCPDGTWLPEANLTPRFPANPTER